MKHDVETADSSYRTQAERSKPHRALTNTRLTALCTEATHTYSEAVIIDFSFALIIKHSKLQSVRAFFYRNMFRKSCILCKSVRVCAVVGTQIRAKYERWPNSSEHG